MENEDYEKITSANIMIIDEDVNMMEVLSAVLKKYGHVVKAYTEPISAIEELKSQKYDILIVNYLMSTVNGDKIIELVREFDKEIYIILMSMHKDLALSMDDMRNLDIQAYFEKSSRFDQLVMFVQGGIKYIEQLKNIKKMNLQLEHYLVDFASILLKTIEAKDHFTEEHSYRVSNMCALFADYINLTPKEKNDLVTAAKFHDVGKIGVPDSVLMKEGKLTNDEYETMKLHTVIGATIFSTSDIFKDVTPIIKGHHERVDGKGYPDKLKSDQISKLTKMLTLCDSFDAIVSKRVYKDARSVEDALKEIDKNSGKQFDSYLAYKFIDMVNENRELVDKIIEKKKK